MKIVKFISIFVLLIGFTFALVQCAKEEKVNFLEENSNIELRYDYEGADCNPQDLYSRFSNCSFYRVTDTITIFNNLSSSGNYLFKMCPNVELKVSYFITECWDTVAEHQVTLISGLTYDMYQLFEDCPELRSAVRRAYYLGKGYVELLDIIDDEISQQIEEKIAYNRVLSDHIDCTEGYYSIKYIKNTCYRWEMVPILCEEGGFCWKWDKVDCGSSVCCARFNRYCASFYPDGSIRNFVKYFPTEYETFEGECEDECSHDCGK
jgi:hypothetical protein